MALSMDTSIQYLKGVGEKRAQLYKKLGVETIGQLLYYFPRSYLDFSQVQEMADCTPGEVCAIRAVVAGKSGEQHIRKGLSLFKVQAFDPSSSFIITFFNAKYTVDALKTETEYIFYGKVTTNGRKKELHGPMVFPCDGPAQLSPVYPLTQGLTSKIIAANVKQALSLIDETIPDPIPAALRQQYSLCHLHYALQAIHQPADQKAAEIAKRRLIFEEFLTLSLSLASVRSKHTASTTYQCAAQAADMEDFFAHLPFSPTGAQRRAIADLCQDMSQPVPMNRLVQGDVGTGKTLVAAAGIYFCCKNGFQAAMMAPTEILARQHYENLEKILSPWGLRVRLLTGSMSAKEKRQVKEEIQLGMVDLCVGTHALITDNVAFPKLALVITDEQHRFGVEQRTKLGAKAQNPHALVMSATPIPRTLALMIYGDLDVSVLDELPPGRQPVDTFVISSEKRQRAYGYIQKHLRQGFQAYIVCPLVEAGEVDMGLMNASEYAQLAAEAFAGYQVGLLHGKMKPKEKDAVMERFKAGEIQVLVSTTVIEVGVDVPNAVIMMIENAERFGLSQLHQLRGRVGRGSAQSTCILVSDAKNPETRERLAVMHQTGDGFRIAEYDLKTRGPGDFLGKRQHGLPQLKIADLSGDMELLMQAQQAAQQVLSHTLPMEAEERRRLAAAVKAMLRTVGDRPN